MTSRIFGTAKRYIGCTLAGFANRLNSRLSGRTCSFAKHIVSKLDDCELWSNHFEQSSLKNIDMSLKEADFTATRFLLAMNVKDYAKRYCVDLAMTAVEILAQGEEVTFSTFLSLE